MRLSRLIHASAFDLRADAADTFLTFPWLNQGVRRSNLH